MKQNEQIQTQNEQMQEQMQQMHALLMNRTPAEQIINSGDGGDQRSTKRRRTDYPW